MIQQSPASPVPPDVGQSQLSPQDRAAIAQSIRDAQATAIDAQQVAAKAQRDAGTAGAVGVLKDPGGRVIVKGPDGRQVIIDPKAGLDGDQIQEVVQHTLQPVRLQREEHGPSGVWIPILAIVLGFLTVLALIVSRTVRARYAAVGARSGAAALPPETVARIARIEQAVEAVAIEVERISEAQRYSAQLLTERLPSAGATVGAVAAGRGAP